MSTTTSEAVGLHILPVHEEAQLRGLASQWNELAGDCPFRSWEWMQSWWRHYQDSHSRLFTLLVIDDQDEVVGIAPWYVSSALGARKIVRFLGSGEVCSDYLTLLCRGGSEQAVASRVADWLATEAANEWRLLDFSGVEAADLAMTHLAERLAHHGQIVDRQIDQNCWRVALESDWKSFLGKLSKSRRERTRTLLRRAVESGRAVVHEVRTEAELPRAFEILVDLHQRRRRSLSQRGCFASERFTNFHREVASRFLETDQLRLRWIELEGRPLVAEYSLAGNETLYYYLGGFEPDLAQESPGWLGLAAGLKRSVEEGYRNYDFLRGDESYKASWGATARPLVHVRVVGRQTSARLRYAGWRACKSAKSWAKQLLP